MCSQMYAYSSVRKFVIEGTDENGENWYMTNNNQFTVLHMIFVMNLVYSKMSGKKDLGIIRRINRTGLIIHEFHFSIMDTCSYPYCTILNVLQILILYNLYLWH